MIREYLLAILLPPLLIVAWIAVQRLVHSRYPSRDEHGDVLAGSDCGSCGCRTPCDEYTDTTPGPGPRRQRRKPT